MLSVILIFYIKFIDGGWAPQFLFWIVLQKVFLCDQNLRVHYFYCFLSFWFSYRRLLIYIWDILNSTLFCSNTYSPHYLCSRTMPFDFSTYLCLIKIYEALIKLGWSLFRNLKPQQLEINKKTTMCLATSSTTLD